MLFLQTIRIWIIVLIVLSQQGLAASIIDSDNKNFPTGCHAVGYHFELKTLYFMPEHSGARQSLYLVFNRLTEPVALFQMRADGGTRNLYLNHAIAQKSWAVFATSELSLKFTCTVADGSSAYGRVVECAHALRVCEYEHVKFGLNNRGNFWLANSYTRNEAVNAIVHYGIIPDIHS